MQPTPEVEAAAITLRGSGYSTFDGRWLRLPGKHDKAPQWGRGGLRIRRDRARGAWEAQGWPAGYFCVSRSDYSSNHEK